MPRWKAVSSPDALSMPDPWHLQVIVPIPKPVGVDREIGTDAFDYKMSFSFDGETLHPLAGASGCVVGVAFLCSISLTWHDGAAKPGEKVPCHIKPVEPNGACW